VQPRWIINFPTKNTGAAISNRRDPRPASRCGPRIRKRRLFLVRPLSGCGNGGLDWDAGRRKSKRFDGTARGRNHSYYGCAPLSNVSKKRRAEMEKKTKRGVGASADGPNSADATLVGLRVHQTSRFKARLVSANSPYWQCTEGIL